MTAQVLQMRVSTQKRGRYSLHERNDVWMKFRATTYKDFVNGATMRELFILEERLGDAIRRLPDASGDKAAFMSMLDALRAYIAGRLRPKRLSRPGFPVPLSAGFEENITRFPSGEKIS